ncbi:hypothetical protein [Acinetobacter rudis]|nr:hypothetical protein [Acinetobacter rudis]
MQTEMFFTETLIEQLDILDKTITQEEHILDGYLHNTQNSIIIIKNIIENNYLLIKVPELFPYISKIITDLYDKFKYWETDLINGRTKEELENFSNQLLVLANYLSTIRDLNLEFNKYTTKLINQSIVDVNKELETFKRLRNIADNGLTEGIYNNAVLKYQKFEKKYRKYFYRTVATVLILAFLLLLFKSKVISALQIGDTEFWVLKVSLLVVGVTLISYFVKQSVHYQKLADQNYQTQIELQAYPSFMESIPTNEAASIRKELALKYFGREIDGSTHKDMSNLILDQMKSTTELVKASAEVVKGFNQPLAKSADPSNPKDTPTQ